jgi:hypothetical protein
MGFRFPQVSTYSVEDKTQRRQCKMWSSKKLTCKVILRQVLSEFIHWRHSVMFVFSSQVWDLYSPALKSSL